MGFIKAGFTGGFIGIVIGVGAIFTNYNLLQKLSSLGFLLAKSFGKVCIDTQLDSCSLADKFTTVLATIIGNCIAYFILGVIISLGISVIKLWLKPEPKTEQTPIEKVAQQSPQATQTVQTPVPLPDVIKVTKEPKRPEAKAKISRKKLAKN